MACQFPFKLVVYDQAAASAETLGSVLRGGSTLAGWASSCFLQIQHLIPILPATVTASVKP
jgi:hypothetical protein